MSDARQQQLLAWLRTMPFFEGMTLECLAALLPRLKRRRLADGETLCSTGDPAGCGWLVVRGALQIRSPKGREVTRIETGGAFGLGTLLGHQPRIFGATAIGETWLLEMDRGTWNEIIARRDHVSLSMAESLAVMLAPQMRHADEILRGLRSSGEAVTAPAPARGQAASRKGAPGAAKTPARPVEGLERLVRPSPASPAAGSRRQATRISEEQLESFLDELESKVGIQDQSDIRVVHSAEKPVRPKTPGF